MIKVLFFGQLADIAQRELGNSETSLSLTDDVTEITLSDLRLELGKKSTVLAEEINKSSNLCAINQVINKEDIMIKNSDEVAFMSPLSGG